MSIRVLISTESVYMSILLFSGFELIQSIVSGINGKF